jgi:hypothetical protein
MLASSCQVRVDVVVLLDHQDHHDHHVAGPAVPRGPPTDLIAIIGTMTRPLFLQ